MPPTFGTRLAAAMKASRMRASDLAGLCNVRPQTVAKWLKMREARLEARHAACIAAAMGADLVQLITGVRKFRTRSKASK